MSDIFVNSGENGDVTAGPSPQLQGLFIPGIDNPLALDGFGIVTPWGGGSTTRRYGEYGISGDISRQTTQLADLASSLVPAGEGGISFGLEGPQGIQGLRGERGLPGIITVLGLNLPQNSNFVAALPHNIDQINQLGLAADKLPYTNSLITYTSDFVWTERQPVGDTNKAWRSIASDSDGSHLIIAVYGGGLYTSDDSGVTWTERTPDGAGIRNWYAVASDSDGSNLIAAIITGRLYTSSDYGVSWTQRTPTGSAEDIDWTCVASDSDGSHLIVGEDEWEGRIYTSSNYGVSWTEREPTGDPDDRYWQEVASDADGSHLMASKDDYLYTSSNSGVTWTKRHPTGDSDDRVWWFIASDSDGSNLIVGTITNGYEAIYTSSNYGVNWTKRLPAGAGVFNWTQVASDADGSHLAAAEMGTGKIYTSKDYGVSWEGDSPGGSGWYEVASDSDGSNLLVAGYGGRVYTGATEVLYYEATWAETDLTSAGRDFLAAETVAEEATILGLGTSDSPVWAGATFTGVVTGVTPTAGTHFATKEYVDLALGARKTFFLSDTGSGVGALNYAYPHETSDDQSTVVTDPALGADDPDPQLIKGFITEAGEPATTTIHAGVVIFHFHAKKGNSNQRTTVLKGILSKVAANGTSSKVTIATTENSPELTDTETAYTLHATLGADVEILSTDRLILDIYASVGSGAQDAVITLYLEGTEDSYFSATVDSGIWQRQTTYVTEYGALEVLS